MYDLGDNFKIPTFANVAKPECVYKGEKYRFTILSERLIRLEYNQDGIFEDRPTEFAWNREFPVPKFAVKEDTKYFELKTSYFTLTYTKNNKWIIVEGNSMTQFYGQQATIDKGIKKEFIKSIRYNENNDKI